MNIESWLKQATKKLETVGIGTARLDALVLLEDELNIDRAQLLAEPMRELTNEQIKSLDVKIRRRMTHEPLAYIRGKTEFYGREFYVDRRVLEPRPESETILKLLKPLPLPAHTRIADVGTGSGALGITASLELPNVQVDLLELDKAALRVAQKNVIKFATNNQLITSDLLANASGQYDVLLCNLPYVPDDFHINPAATAEPKIAIFGGPDGLDLYRRLFAQIKDSQQVLKYILTESMPPQHTKLAQIAQTAGYSLEQIDDFIQLFTTG